MHQQVIEIEGRGRGFTEVSEAVQRVVAASGARIGLCHLFLQHTSASLCLTENAAPDVRADLESWAQTLAPDGGRRYRHDDEGPDDVPAHIRSLVVGVELSVPIGAGRLLLGTWQGLYLWEHRRHPLQRRIVVTIHGA
ncbi:secondary thiamine-phosphate synthase enzyme YjbQ [Solimonas variicoloris]|uniref:secondary thiamine-phosphate synthase enzyme YjbQ n=1 Tax=Solimonas variicoloris TaxID=254408 RepID=UPI00035EC5BF|nr:secondary thiamine-phosphate synthase enzyme YjbQ [Solimonas variicoloris]